VTLEVVAETIHEVDGEGVVFFAAFLVEDLQDPVAARLEADGHGQPVRFPDQRLEQIRPLAHGVWARRRPVRPGSAGLARIGVDPFPEPVRVLKEHRVMNHDGAERSIRRVEVVELVDDHLDGPARHV
jgi:hypothetical protein